MGLKLDEVAVTSLETWHLLGRSFCPSVELVFPELWGRLTASFRGSTTSGWAWNHHKKEESPDLAPDQARLAFAISNALATLTLDGIVSRIDPEDPRPLAELGSVVLQAEQEGILEGEETLGLRALRLGAEDTCGEEGQDPRPRVMWSGVQVAYCEPLGRIRWAGIIPIREEEERLVLQRKKEVIMDIFTWEESISRVMLLGPEHQKPVMEENEELPEPPGSGILRNLAPDMVRRANERLGLDPDDLDFATERFADLRLNEPSRRQVGRTPSPPPPPKYDVHGLWAEERHRQSGGRHRGPPRLRWQLPKLKEPQKKRDRDPESQVEAWREAEDREEQRHARPPPNKRSRETKKTGSPSREEQHPVTASEYKYSWPSRRGGRMPGRGYSRTGSCARGRGVEDGGRQASEHGHWNRRGGRRGGSGRRRGR